MMINTARIICHRIGVLKQYDDASDSVATNYALTISRDILQELENVCFTSSYQEKYNESKQLALRGTNQQAPTFQDPLSTVTNVIAESVPHFNATTFNLGGTQSDQTIEDETQ